MKNVSKTEVDLTLVAPTLGVLILFGAWIGVQGFPNGSQLAQAQKELAAAQQSAVPTSEVARLGEERDALKLKTEEAEDLLKSRRKEAERVVGTTTAPVWRLQTLNRVHAALQKAGVAVAWDFDSEGLDALLGSRTPADPTAGGDQDDGPAGDGGTSLALDNPQLLKTYRDALAGLARAHAESSRPASAQGAPAIDPTAFAEVPEGFPGGAFAGAAAVIQPPTPELRVLRLEATYRQMLTALGYLQQSPGETMAVAAYLRRPTAGGAGDGSLDWVLLLHIRSAPAGDVAAPPEPTSPPFKKAPPGGPAPKRGLLGKDPAVVSAPRTAPADSERKTSSGTRLDGARRTERATVWTSPAILERSRNSQEEIVRASAEIRN